MNERLCMIQLIYSVLDINGIVHKVTRLLNLISLISKI